MTKNVIIRNGIRIAVDSNLAVNENDWRVNFEIRLNNIPPDMAIMIDHMR